jgi:phage terminase large subunit
VRYCCGFIVANANGHNWIYKLWVNSKDPSRYFLVQATTFENAHNLPKEFIEDLKHKEIEAPSHYRRYVLNDHNEQDAGDFLFDTRMLEDAVNNKLSGIEKGAVIVGLDVARFGDDRTVLCGIQYLGGLSWKQIFVRAYSGNDTMVTVGRAMDIIYEFSPVALVVDDIGVGGGVVDRLNELMGNTSGGVRIVRFLANDTKTLSESDAKRFCYKRDVAYFRLKDMIEKKTIQLLANEDLKNDLSCLRFTYRNGKKTLLSKAELKKLGYKSPDMADSLSMAVSEVFNVHKDDMFKRDKGEFSDGWRVVEPPDDSEEMGRHR